MSTFHHMIYTEETLRHMNHLWYDIYQVLG